MNATALLVHGMGSVAAWWEPLQPVLTRHGLRPHAVELPSLESSGPESWTETVLRAIPSKGHAVLIGHSLGGGVCLDVVRQRAVDLLVLLAVPPFWPGCTPLPPPRTSLSAAAIDRVERYLRQVCAGPPPVGVPVVHFVGSKDRWVSEEQSRKGPFEVRMIAGAGHSLVHSTHLAQALGEVLGAHGFGS